MSSRFARHELIPGWRQDRLAKAMVLVVGVGALGNEVARALAMAGIGRFLLCDPDRVEESNLSRTILFRPGDVGAPKVVAAARALREIHPGIEIDSRAAPLATGIGLAELRDVDLVLSCLDSRWDRLQLASRCNLVRAPSIDGGTHAWGGEVRPYLDADGPCYACSLAPGERAVADVPEACRAPVPADVVGASIPTSALVAAWMSTIALRFLMGLPCPEALLRIDAERAITVLVEQRRDPDCLLHRPLGPVQPISVSSREPMRRLRAELASGEVPLAWNAVTFQVKCPRCRYTAPVWSFAPPSECPECGGGLRSRTTLELADVPDDVPLDTIGVAPREIMPVRQGTRFRYVELAAQTGAEETGS